MNAFDLKNKLADQAETVCRYLLPNGKRSKNEWQVGNIQGDPGKSLGVELSGPKTGYWVDRANPTDAGKSLLSLWAHAKCGGDRESAIHQAKEFLGVRDDYDKNIRPAAPKSWKEPEKKGYTLLGEKGKVFEYLRDDRMIKLDVLKEAKVCESKQGNAYVFPFWEPDGTTLRMLKFVKLVRDAKGKKSSWVNPSGGAKPILYGMESVPKDADSVIICEGEIDSLSWRTLAFHAVSIPMGVQNEEWIPHCWDWLARFETIYICFDTDEAGTTAAKKVADRLGKERCWLVDTNPYKDMNEALVDGIEYPEQLLENAVQIVPPEIQGFFDERGELEQRVLETDEALTGVRTPWPDLPFGIRASENTVVSGFCGHGKSVGLLQLCNHLAFEGWPGMIASLEVPTVDSKAIILQQAHCRDDVTAQDLERAQDSHLSRLYFYDIQGRVHWKRLLDCYKFGVKKYGFKFLVIDSFMLCGVSKKDLDGQNDFMNEIQVCQRGTGTHLFVVAHSRKPEANKEIFAPDKYEIEGSGDIANLAYNILVFHRNIAKERKLESAIRKGDTMAEASARQMPDGTIHLRKQKTGGRKERGKLGSQAVSYHMASQQLVPQGEVPMRYIDGL